MAAEIAQRAKIDFATLHRHPNRLEVFRAGRGKPPIYDRPLNAWVVTDEEQVHSLLQSPHLSVSTYADSYAALEARCGRTFPNLAFAFRHIPLCLDGADHKDKRRRMAAFLTERRCEVAAVIPAFVREGFAVFDHGSEFDIASDVLAPLVTRFMLFISGLDANHADMGRTTLVFDRLLGLSKRARLEQDVALLRAKIRKTIGANASHDDEGLRLALFILGQDALFGTLGESLFRILSKQTGARLSEIKFPPQPCDGGVPYVERIVSAPICCGGLAFEPGQRLRIMLQGFSDREKPGDMNLLFGGGSHSCLGRLLSLDLWRAVVGRLSEVVKRAEVLTYELRSDDYVFTCPKTFRIRLTA